jgi:transketolase
MIRSGWAKTDRPTSRSSIWRRCGRFPNLRTLRPADAMETAECWQMALERTDGPTVLALTRQNVPAVRLEASRANLCAQGAYELVPAEGGKADATIFASGSEIEIAVAARKTLRTAR